MFCKRLNEPHKWSFSHAFRAIPHGKSNVEITLLCCFHSSVWFPLYPKARERGYLQSPFRYQQNLWYQFVPLWECHCIRFILLCATGLIVYYVAYSKAHKHHNNNCTSHNQWSLLHNSRCIQLLFSCESDNDVLSDTAYTIH